LLKEDSREKALQRARVAGENTWERRVESIVRILNTFVAEETRPA
jgi:hypothetical protein